MIEWGIDRGATDQNDYEMVLKREKQREHNYFMNAFSNQGRTVPL